MGFKRVTNGHIRINPDILVETCKMNSIYNYIVLLFSQRHLPEQNSREDCISHLRNRKTLVGNSV